MHCGVRPAGWWWVALSELEPGMVQTGTSCHSQTPVTGSELLVSGLTELRAAPRAPRPAGWAGMVCLLEISSSVQLSGCQLLLDSATGVSPGLEKKAGHSLALLNPIWHEIFASGNFAHFPRTGQKALAGKREAGRAPCRQREAPDVAARRRGGPGPWAGPSGLVSSSLCQPGDITTYTWKEFSEVRLLDCQSVLEIT